MSIFSLLKKTFSRKKGVSSSFSKAEQSYDVVFETVFSNNSSHEKNISVILPVPIQDEFQEITKPPTIEHEAEKVTKDETYHNPYAVIRLKLTPGKPQTIREHFSVRVKPQQAEMGSYALSDYAQAKLPQEYLSENRYLKVDEETKRIAGQVIEGAKDVKTIIDRLNSYVVKRLRYGSPIRGLYSAEEALRKPQVDCGGFDTLLISLCLALGIPARIVSGFWLGYPLNHMHAWIEIMLPDGTWIPADPSLEKLRQEKRTEKEGGLGFAGSDRLKLSRGCDIEIPLDGRIEVVPLLQHPALFAREGLNGLEVQTSLLAKRLL